MKKIIFIIFLFFAFQAHTNSCLDRLNHRMISKNTLVCVGLDPDPSKMPREIMNRPGPVEEKVYDFLTAVIDLTAEHACAYKLQKAFYDDFAQGHILLQKVVKYIKEHNEGIPVFVDCKIGDIENTMDVYIHNLFEQIKSDGVVVNPYMGDDVFQPFAEDPEKVAIVLVQTSNPSAKILQELKLNSGELLWERVLLLTLNRWGKNQNLIPILSSNSVDTDYKSLRKLIPSQTPILLAGIGAQGGNLQTLKDLLNDDNAGVFVNSSRAILYPYPPDSSGWRESILQAVVQFKKQINGIRYE